MNLKRTVVQAILFSAILTGGQGTSDEAMQEAQSLRSQGKSGEAIEVLQRAIRQFPRNPDLRTQLASVLGEAAGSAANTGDFSAAMAHTNAGFAQLDSALALDPNHFNASFAYGVFAVNVPVFMGRLDGGVRRMEKAKSLMEANPSAVSPDQKTALYRYLGQGYRMQNRMEDAESAWKRVLTYSSSGQDADAAKKGLEAIKMERAAAQAAASKEQSPATGPANEAPGHDAASLIQTGKTRLSERKWTEAADAFRQAVRQDSSDAEAFLLLARALGGEAAAGYDERIYRDQTFRTNLAFEVTRTLEKARRLHPDNPEIRLFYAVMCIQMPFFVGKMDEGLSILESMSKDAALSDSLRNEATYELGFGFRKKGRGIWADFVKNNPDAGQASLVYREYGLRETAPKPAAGERVQVQFHLGFQDEIEPQTALWVEDADGKFVKTLYVSGFSGFAKEKQVVLPEFAKRAKFETDGNTGASIDWGGHSYAWDLTGPSGKKVRPGAYTVVLEASWWPSMRYESAEAEIRVGGKASETTVSRDPFIPRLRAQYIPKN
jgi:tetratricopeptide (TPR) repeat protein